MRINRFPFALLVVALSCGGPKQPETVAELPNLDTSRVLADITRLSADEMQGRAPGSDGERLAVQYLTDQFKAAGLEPGNPDGTWVQKVPLVGIKPTVSSPFTIKQNGKARQMNVPGDIVPFSRRVTDTVSVADSDASESQRPSSVLMNEVHMPLATSPAL